MMMLVHIGQVAIAEIIHNAWLATIEEGVHSADIYRKGVSKQQVGILAFAIAVIAHLEKFTTVIPIGKFQYSLIINLWQYLFIQVDCMNNN